MCVANLSLENIAEVTLPDIADKNMAPMNKSLVAKNLDVYNRSNDRMPA